MDKDARGGEGVAEEKEFQASSNRLLARIPAFDKGDAKFNTCDQGIQAIYVKAGAQFIFLALWKGDHDAAQVWQRKKRVQGSP
jgi:hypothetical protein